MTNYPTLAARLWKKVKIGGPDECWEWQRYQCSRGYGRIRPGGLAPEITAHRAAWIVTRGHPGSLHVLHKCDNPPCCNPKHLFLGTNADNMRDRDLKGRGTPTPKYKGEAHPRAVLTEKKVLAARNSKHTTEFLAEKYGVSRSAMRDARNGKTWRHLK